MPELSKKILIESEEARITPKSPTLIEEHIEKVLDYHKITNSLNESLSNNNSVSSKCKKIIEKVLSIQLSAKEPNSQHQYSDKSDRMNEPAISLSQSTMTKKNCSTASLKRSSESMGLSTPSQITPLHNMSLIEDEINVPSQDGKEQTSSQKSVFSFTQSIPNKKRVIEKYLSIVSETQSEEFNFMKNFKEPARKNTTLLSHSNNSAKSNPHKKGLKFIENEPSRKKLKQNKETAGKKVLKKPRSKKDVTEKQKNKKLRKENHEHAGEQEMSLYDRMLLIQESRNVGLYSICDTCDKHRYLPDVKDPLELPEKWYCHMNPDPDHNKCIDPEEPLVDEEYLIENLYNAGSIVWAKAEGWPWWPAMVEDDPDTETYFYLENDLRPTMYHVTFFDSCEVTRAWIRPPSLKPFKINMTNPEFQIPKSRKLKLRLEFAVKQAQDALNLSSIDRLKKYSFIQRYAKPLKDIMVKNKSSKKKSKSQKRDSNGIYLAKKKRICRKILSTDSETDTNLNNMNLKNDNI